MNMNNEQLTMLNKSVAEGVDSKLREASEKDLLNSIIETTRDKFIRGLITKKFDMIYDVEKYVKNKDKIETLYELLEGMK